MAKVELRTAPIRAHVAAKIRGSAMPRLPEMSLKKALGENSTLGKVRRKLRTGSV